MKKILGMILIITLATLTSCIDKEEEVHVIDNNIEVPSEIEKLIDEVIEVGGSEEENIVDEVIVEEEQELVAEVDEEDIEETAIDLSTALLSGNGTEPFWGFSASGTTLVLREASQSGPMSETTYSNIILTNVNTGISIAAPGMSLDLLLGTCSDGMSDIVYAYSTNFVTSTTNYTGCANVD